MSGPAGGGSSASGRILSADECVRRLAPPRDRRLVFTNGVFDLLHVGHVSYLERARALGDLLLVAVNSDDSARRLKGRGRPLQPAADRTRLLAALRCVDLVTVFDTDTPAPLIERLLPDVLVKGADYTEEQVAGAGAVRAAGGEVRLLALERGRSTTELLRKIRAAPASG